MPAEFFLELYFEHDVDRAFAEGEANKLTSLVRKLAPHIALHVSVLNATNILRRRFCCDGRSYDVPNQAPSRSGRQSLLITSEDIQAEGWAGSKQGCLSKQRMEEKERNRGSSADITIHEWMHTIEGLQVDGRRMPDPHSNASFGFTVPSGRGGDGQDIWHDWYAFALRGC
jgi:hypothetical protein